VEVSVVDRFKTRRSKVGMVPMYEVYCHQTGVSVFVSTKEGECKLLAQNLNKAEELLHAEG
jgi:cytochrome c oxidase assembly protein Cox11